MIHIEIRYDERSADNIGMVEPIRCGKLFLGILLDHMLGQSQQISRIAVFKGSNRHFFFGRKLYRFIVYLLNAVDALCTFLYKAVVANAFKYIIHHCSIADDRACQAKCGINHIICRNRRSVRPGCSIIDVNDKVFVIFCCDGICQHALEVQVSIQLHQRQKHQSGRIFVNLAAV